MLTPLVKRMLVLKICEYQNILQEISDNRSDLSFRVTCELTFHWYPKEMGSGQLLMNSVKEK